MQVGWNKHSIIKRSWVLWISQLDDKVCYFLIIVVENLFAFLPPFLLVAMRHSQVVRYANKVFIGFILYFHRKTGTWSQKKNPRIFPPRCFLLASSWSMMPPEVVSTTYPNCLEGRRLLVHFSMSPMAMSNLGEITPHLFRRPVRLTTILPDLWSSMTWKTSQC